MAQRRLSTAPRWSASVDPGGERAALRATVARTARRSRRRSSLMRLVGLVDGMPGPGFVCDDQGRFLHVNDAFEAMTGTVRNDVIGRSALDVMPPDVAHVFAAAGASASSGGTHTAHLVMTTPAGPHRMMRVSWVPASFGRCTGTVGFAIDVTGLESAGADSAWLAALVTSTADAVVSIRDGVVVTWNPAAETVLGYSASEMVGVRAPRFARSLAADRARWMALIRRVESGEAVRAETLPWLHPDGTTRMVAVTGTPVPPDIRGRRGTSWIARDADDAATYTRELERIARTDEHTGLANRRAFDAAMAAATEAREAGVVLVVDVDDFSGVNNALGHRGGDAVLRLLSSRLRSACGDVLVARIGGDEFAVYCRGSDEEHARELAERIGEAVTEWIGPESVAEIERSAQLRVTASIGIASTLTGPGHTVLGDADVALWEAKRRGPGEVVAFTPELYSVVHRRRRLTADLLVAAERGQLRVVYQPVVSMQDGGLTGTEALLRWEHPDLGAISPVEFIPLAESTHAIHVIGEWVLRRAIADAAEWQTTPTLDGVGVAVNVSVRQLTDDAFPELVDAIVREVGLPVGLLTLEVTETALAENLDELVPSLLKLRAQGVGIAIDDFGTGYSSLSYLHRIPATSIKIDRSITSDLTTDISAVAIVESLTQLAATLGLDVIAEGIEEAAERGVLTGLGVGYGQGWLFSKALDRSELAQVAVHAWRPSPSVAASTVTASSTPAESAVTATYTMDRDRRVVTWDGGAEALTGYASARAVGHPCHHALLMHTDEDGRLLCGDRCPMLAVMADGRPRDARVFFQHADGHRVPSLVHGEAIRDASGTIVGSIETFTDDSPHRMSVEHAEAALAAARTDAVTGLPNRRRALVALADWLVAPGGPASAVIRVDLIPTRAGAPSDDPEVADAVVATVARTLSGATRPADYLARTGPGQFLVLAVAETVAELDRHATALHRLIAATAPSHAGRRVPVRAEVAVVHVTPGDTYADVLATLGIPAAAPDLVRTP
jgi:diguanylate cyclase (GGDEF)-like protein/PAS domain S-box-containing protein